MKRTPNIGSFKSKGRTLEKRCLICEKKFNSHVSQKSKFCSRPCFHKYREKDLRKPCLVCKNLFEKITSSGRKRGSAKLCSRKCFKEYMRIIKTGKKNPHSIEWRKKVSEAQKGEKSHHWMGGITPINKKIRHSLKMKLWREAVFRRDDHTCQLCKQRGGTLNADHIKPFAYFPELRFELSNGRTLCVPCHKMTETYGGKVIVLYKTL